MYIFDIVSNSIDIIVTIVSRYSAIEISQCLIEYTRYIHKNFQW